MIALIRGNRRGMAAIIALSLHSLGEKITKMSPAPPGQTYQSLSVFPHFIISDFVRLVDFTVKDNIHFLNADAYGYFKKKTFNGLEFSPTTDSSHCYGHEHLDHAHQLPCAPKFTLLYVYPSSYPDILIVRLGARGF